MRKHHGARKWLLWALAILWLFIIVWLSSENGETSAKTSMRLSAFLAGLFKLPEQDLAHLDRDLRIAAHFIGFLIMGALCFSAVRCTWIKSKKTFVWTLIVCCGIAVVDEAKKILITGRHFSLVETVINLAGVGYGVWLMTSVFRRVEKE